MNVFKVGDVVMPNANVFKVFSASSAAEAAACSEATTVVEVDYVMGDGTWGSVTVAGPLGNYCFMDDCFDGTKEPAVWLADGSKAYPKQSVQRALAAASSTLLSGFNALGASSYRTEQVFANLAEVERVVFTRFPRKVTRPVIKKKVTDVTLE